MEQGAWGLSPRDSGAHDSNAAVARAVLSKSTMETATIDPEQSVASLVLDHSECAAVFQQLRIDFCCKGELSVAAAARSKGIEPATLVQSLARAIDERHGGDRALDPRELSTPRLVAHIVSKHHEYLRRALPFVGGLAAKVSRVHGDHNPKLRELAVAVDELAGALIPHLDEEEGTLFPALVSGATDRELVAKELGAMQEEHLAVAKILQRVRAASEDFTLPSWACNSYRTLFSELEQVEGDVFTHVHIENHVLRPRFAAA
jgi:regulator of cell morphogenesis and NO signaling